jgi:sterol 14alpha-demethylase
VREELFAEVSKLYNDLDQGITPISVFFPNAPIPSHFKRNAARKEMVKLFSKVRLMFDIGCSSFPFALR